MLSGKYSKARITIKNNYKNNENEMAFGSMEEFQENFDLLTIIEKKEE